MNEIEKMMQNANVKKHWNSTPYGGVEEYYPPFTAEKQIQLENFLLEDVENKTFTQFEMLKTVESKFLYIYRYSENNSILKRFDTLGETRKESLSRLINKLWQDLTDAEKAQIKNILESEVRE